MKILLYENGACTFSEGKGRDSDSCRTIGNNTKTYSLSNCHYRNIVSAAFKISRESRFELNFYTFTFANNPTEVEGNKAIKHFFKTFVRIYGESRYVWTKERQKNGKLHYHALIDSGYIPVKTLQGMWNDSIVYSCGNCATSSNSFRLPPKENRRLFAQKDVIAVARYIAKYISKERGLEYEQPCFAISKNLYPLSVEISLEHYESLYDTFGIVYEKKYDYCSVIQLQNATNYR